MAINLGGGGTSAFASMQLSSAQELLTESLMRLSSGRRIISPADDPVGLAVSMRLENAITITGATKNNVDNAQSFTDTQDSALEAVGNILDRMSVLRTSYIGGTATAEEQASYNTEFIELSKSLAAYKSETFNGISLFKGTDDLAASTPMTVYTSTAGASGAGIGINPLNLDAALAVNGNDPGEDGIRNPQMELEDATGALQITDVTLGSLTEAISNVASLRATTGATSSRLGFASDFLSSSKTNLEAANSRIIDVDVAEETTNYAKYNLQSYAAAAALAQSNLNLGIVMDLLNSAGNRS